MDQDQAKTQTRPDQKRPDQHVETRQEQDIRPGKRRQEKASDKRRHHTTRPTRQTKEEQEMRTKDKRQGVGGWDKITGSWSLYLS